MPDPSGPSTVVWLAATNGIGTTTQLQNTHHGPTWKDRKKAAWFRDITTRKTRGESWEGKGKAESKSTQSFTEK